MLQQALGFGAGLQQNPLGFCLDLALRHLALAIHLRLGLAPELLGGDQRVVHGALSIAIGAELLAHPLHPLIELHPLPHQAVDFFSHTLLELIDLRGVVAAQGALKLLCAHVV